MLPIRRQPESWNTIPRRCCSRNWRNPVRQPGSVQLRRRRRRGIECPACLRNPRGRARIPAGSPVSRLTMPSRSRAPSSATKPKSSSASLPLSARSLSSTISIFPGTRDSVGRCLLFLNSTNQPLRSFGTRPDTARSAQRMGLPLYVTPGGQNSELGLHFPRGSYVPARGSYIVSAVSSDTNKPRTEPCSTTLPDPVACSRHAIPRRRTPCTRADETPADRTKPNKRHHRLERLMPLHQVTTHHRKPRCHEGHRQRQVPRQP